MNKTPLDSMVDMTELVLPNDTNLLGNLLGGRLLHWVDIAGALAATRYARKAVATASIESVDFRHAIKMGELVMLHAKVVWVGHTSMQVIVKVTAENPLSGATVTSNKAYLTFVALDENGKPSPVPPIRIETEEDQKNYNDAQKRYEQLKAKRKK